MRTLRGPRAWRTGAIALILSAFLLGGCAGQAPSPAMSAGGPPGATLQSGTATHAEMVAATVAPAAAAATRLIIAIGSGSVNARPDRAIVNVGVQSRATTAQAAHDHNNQAMQAVVDAIKAIGIPQSAIRTGGVSLYPTTDQQNAINGYTATNQVAVTLDNVDQAGTLLDTAVRAGANMAGDIQFTMKDPGALRDQALTAAIADAKAKAATLARASGMTLSGIISVSESGAGQPVTRAPAGLGGGAPDAAVEPGEVTVTAQVAVTFEASSQ